MRYLLTLPLLLIACGGPAGLDPSAVPAPSVSCGDLHVTLHPGDEVFESVHPCAERWVDGDSFGAGGSFRPEAPLPWWVRLEVVEASSGPALRILTRPNAPTGAHALEFVFQRPGVSTWAPWTLTLDVQDDFRVDVELSADPGGSLAGTPCGARVRACRASYPLGAAVRATARVDEGYRFMGWTGCDALGPALQRIADRPWGCRARFASTAPAGTLEVAVDGEGSVDVEAATCHRGHCTAPIGTRVRLHAVPDPGHAFVAWSSPSGACRGSNPEIELRLEATARCRARFAPSHVLTLELRNELAARARVITSRGAALQCEARGGMQRCVAPVVAGREVVFEARVFGDVAARFHWSGDCAATGPATATLTVEGDHHCALTVQRPF